MAWYAVSVGEYGGPMKKLIICMSVLLMPQICDAKTRNYEHIDVAANKSHVNCFDESFEHYYGCMMECVSKDSPREVIAFCTNKCLITTNKPFIRCVYTGKYAR